MSFLCPGSWVEFSHLVSFVSCRPRDGPRSFLVLPDLAGFAEYQVFCRSYSNLGFSDVLSCFQMRQNSCSIKCNLVKRTIMWLFIYKELCNCHHDLIPEPSHHPRRKPRAPISLFVHHTVLSLVPSLSPRLHFSPGRWSCFLSVSLCVSASELLCLSLTFVSISVFLYISLSLSLSPSDSLPLFSPFSFCFAL